MNPFATFRITDDGELRVDYSDQDPSKGVVACAIEGVEDPTEFAAAFAAATGGNREVIGFISASNEAVLKLHPDMVEARLDLAEESSSYMVSWAVFATVLEDWVAAWNALQAAPEGSN